MALSASVLSAAIRAKLLTPPNNAWVSDNDDLTKLCDAIAEAVVETIVASAVVTIPPGVPVATTGTAAAQAGATTAPAVGTVA